jgi:hypothetical protein
VPDADELPESLKKLIEAWRHEGASVEEIIERLDQLELLAQEERAKLIELVLGSTG